MRMGLLDTLINILLWLFNGLFSEFLLASKNQNECVKTTWILFQPIAVRQYKHEIIFDMQTCQLSVALMIIHTHTIRFLAYLVTLPIISNTDKQIERSNWWTECIDWFKCKYRRPETPNTFLPSSTAQTVLNVFFLGDLLTFYCNVELMRVEYFASALEKKITVLRQ